MAVKKKGGLGKGLDALFEDNATEEGSSALLKLSSIEPNRNQPRRVFEQEALSELAESISQHGVLSPLLVRPLPGGNYQLVAGERRWRAARMAGISEVPVLIRELSDVEVMELALIENLQRENLNPVEEAQGYQRLIDEFGFTQDDVAKRVNKSRPAVTNMLRLLRLPAAVLEFVEGGKLSPGHAKVILGLESPQAMEEMGAIAVKDGLSVRELEKLLKKNREQPEKVTDDENAPLPEVSFGDKVYYSELELALKDALGRKVAVQEKGGKGSLVIPFFSKDDLESLSQRLTSVLEL